MLGHRRATLPLLGRAPDPLEEVLAGEDLAGRGGEEGEEVELLARHRDGLVADRDGAGVAIDDEIAVVEAGGGGLAAAAAEDRPDASLELCEGERLDDEVVGTEVQSADPVVL